MRELLEGLSEITLADVGALVALMFSMGIIVFICLAMQS